MASVRRCLGGAELRGGSRTLQHLAWKGLWTRGFCSAGSNPPPINSNGPPAHLPVPVSTSSLSNPHKCSQTTAGLNSEQGSPRVRGRSVCAPFSWTPWRWPSSAAGCGSRGCGTPAAGHGSCCTPEPGRRAAGQGWAASGGNSLYRTRSHSSWKGSTGHAHRQCQQISTYTTSEHGRKILSQK